jgi:RNA polymerase sigma-70 factor (ECF subfamily)
MLQKYFCPLGRLVSTKQMEAKMDLDANQLSALARKDHEAATVLLIELFYERLYAFLRRLAGNDSDAEDLTQQTFSRAQRALLSFAGRSSVSSWVHGIGYHVYVDWQRARRPTESRSTEWWAECVSHEIAPDETAARTDLARQLFTRVDQLAPDLRDSVHLHYYQGLTLQETADAMEVATSTVKYRLRQALEELQKRFAAERGDSGPPIPLKTA